MSRKSLHAIAAVIDVPSTRGLARFRRRHSPPGTGARRGISSRSCKLWFAMASLKVSAGHTAVSNWAGSAEVLRPTISCAPPLPPRTPMRWRTVRPWSTRSFGRCSPKPSEQSPWHSAESILMTWSGACGVKIAHDRPAWRVVHDLDSFGTIPLGGKVDRFARNGVADAICALWGQSECRR